MQSVSLLQIIHLMRGSISALWRLAMVVSFRRAENERKSHYVALELANWMSR